eukprot:5369251-Prymnesium_polylepis.1
MNHARQSSPPAVRCKMAKTARISGLPPRVEIHPRLVPVLRVASRTMNSLRTTCVTARKART